MLHCHKRRNFTLLTELSGERRGHKLLTSQGKSVPSTTFTIKGKVKSWTEFLNYFVSVSLVGTARNRPLTSPGVVLGDSFRHKRSTPVTLGSTDTRCPMKCWSFIVWLLRIGPHRVRLQGGEGLESERRFVLSVGDFIPLPHRIYSPVWHVLSE